MEDLELRKMINHQMKKRGVTTQKLAEAMNMTYSGVWQMLDKDQLQVRRLAVLTEALQYNFFRELAQRFPYAEPNYTDNSEKEALKERIKELETEVRILKEAITLMKG